MPKVTYIAPDGDAESVTFYGVDFVSGETVDCSDERLLGKARGNGCFIVEDDAAPSRRRAPRVEASPVAPSAATAE